MKVNPDATLAAEAEEVADALRRGPPMSDTLTFAQIMATPPGTVLRRDAWSPELHCVRSSAGQLVYSRGPSGRDPGCSTGAVTCTPDDESASDWRVLDRASAFHGSWLWAVAQARAGHAIRRACWPFWWFFIPVEQDGMLELHYLLNPDPRTPLGDDARGCKFFIYQIPDHGEPWPEYLTRPCAPNSSIFEIDGGCVAATDWETCSPEPLVCRLSPGFLIEATDSIVALGGSRWAPIAGCPDALPGFQKITAFVPESTILKNNTPATFRHYESR